MLLCAYALVSMTEMFSVGGFLQDRKVLVVGDSLIVLMAIALWDKDTVGRLHRNRDGLR